VLDPAITTFLNERRLLWLSRKVKGVVLPTDQEILEQQSRETFSLQSWLVDAAQRAAQLSAATHPGKFSHPDVKINPIVANPEKDADGFLRSGNVSVTPDVYGNAAAMDVCKFLNLRLSDGKTILSHLERETPLIKAQFDLPETAFSTTKQGLLTIKKSTKPINNTNGRIKQVFFPVDARHYHLLSLLTPSSLLFKLKERINGMRFSLHARTGRDAQKANLFFDGEFLDIECLTLIGYGGTKPQNISVLNNENGGTAYLLPSLPPLLCNRIQPPKTCFFGSYLDKNDYRSIFEHWHHQIIPVENDKTVTIHKIDHQCTQEIIFRIVDALWQVRHTKAGWSRADTYRYLPRYQKFWLDQRYEQKRKIWPKYLVSVKQDCEIWFLCTYNMMLGKEAFNLSADDQSQIRTVITRCEGILR